MERRVVFVFVDGLGLGARDDPANPVSDPDLHILANFRPPDWTPPPDGGRPPALPPVDRERPLPAGGTVTATDASLGVEGLPQSATGQTTILTGENAALVLGRHLYGYPTRTLQRILMRTSVLRSLTHAGITVLFANAFRPIFFELGDAVWTKPLSATTWANRAAGLPFCTMEDLRAGRAVYQDITHDSLPPRGERLPPRSPEEAGEILARLSREHAFTLFEFFQTDKAGHAMDKDKAQHELRKLERFLGALLGNLDLATTNLVLTSDHGNIEDLGRKTHTLNPVPTLVFGPDAGAWARDITRLEYMTPRILAALGAEGAPPAGAEGAPQA